MQMANVDLTVAHRENVAATHKAVLEIASEWKGTVYLLGGNSRDGIDCSHFVYQMLNAARTKVAKPYPPPQIIDYRNTATIESSGVFFPTNVPETCDLVLWDSHVGIIVNPHEGKFIGAQTSTGVAEASYATGYWSEKPGKRFLRFVHFF
jgi:cell wall-associated NlpC family hydrolase